MKEVQFGGEKIGAGMFLSIPISEIHGLFEIPCSVCQSLDFQTVQKNPDDSYSPYTEQDIFIENGQYLRMRTNELFSPKTIYIQAREQFSQQVLYLPVNAEVTDKTANITTNAEEKLVTTPDSEYEVTLGKENDVELG